MKYIVLTIIALSLFSSRSTSAEPWQKPMIQAKYQRVFHPGGSFGSGTFEGSGFSTRSPQDAINAACSNGRPIKEQYTAYGYNRKHKRWGWYATVIR